MVGYRAIAAATVVLAATLVAAPAAAGAPPNDAYVDALRVPSAGATVEGTTRSARVSEAEPLPSCARAHGIVWYSVRAPHRGPLVARLTAGGKLDAAISIYRVLRSHQRQIACRRTNTHGRAVVSWYGYREGSYAIGIAQRAQSEAGTFTLTVLPAERPPRPPGTALPAGGIRTTIDPILDASDAWAVTMARGTTYRINLTTGSGCVSLRVYRPHTYSFATAQPVASLDCNGYLVFTPGIDGGGRYSLVVRQSGDQPVKHSYRIQAAAAGADDVAPGVALANGSTVSGRVFGRGIDVVDLYRFAVPRPNNLTTLSLGQRPNVGLDLLVLNETGGSISCACDGKGRQVLRLHLPAGRYFAAVRSRDGSGGRYRLQVLTRDVTTTRISALGSTYVEVPPGTSVPLAVSVTLASHGGRVQIEIDRHDPLASWQFAQSQSAHVGASGQATVSWRPPTVGHWRIRARFLGTPFSSFSESGYVFVHVAAPLE